VWEYSTVVVNGYLNDEELTALGKDGWELCAAYAVFSHVRFIFKRKVSA
jgi:hypothetical protein